MADAIPPPAGQVTPTVQSVVIQPPPLTQWQALKEAGWWTPYDSVVAGMLLVLWVTTLFWLLFRPANLEGTPRTTVIIIILLASISLKLIWLVSLVFRCSWFVLKAHADVAMLPHASARIAVAYLSGQK